MHQKSVYRWLVGTMIALLVMAAGLALACSTEPANPVTPGPGDITVVSTESVGHTHRLTVSGADITTPPPTDRTLDTTTDVGHRHTVNLTPGHYLALQGNGEVTVTSSDVNFHTHDFTIGRS